MAEIIHYDPETVRAPAGGYSMGLQVSGHRRLLFVSGQVPVRPDGTLPDGFAAQAEQAWANVVTVLTEAGMGVEDLLRVTTYLTDRDQAQQNRDIRARFLGAARPASTVMVAATLDPRWLLEIEAVAAR